MLLYLFRFIPGYELRVGVIESEPNKLVMLPILEYLLNKEQIRCIVHKLSFDKNGIVTGKNHKLVTGSYVNTLPIFIWFIFKKLRCWSDGWSVRSGSEQPRIRTWVRGYLLIRSLVRPHCSLICLLRPVCFPRTLRCAYSSAHLLTHSQAHGKVND